MIGDFYCSSCIFTPAMTIYTVARAICRTLYVLFNNLYAIPTYLVWLAILRPLLINHPGLYNKIEGLGYSWLLHFVASWIWTGGYTCKQLAYYSCLISNVELGTLILVNDKSVKLLSFCLQLPFFEYIVYCFEG